MWIFYAFGSAIFAGATSILAKIGIKDVDSNVVTAVRTIVVLIFSWLMVFIVGSAGEIVNITTESFLFLIFSGISTGASWLCYFKALQLGDVNKVTPIDKSSTILTMILAFIFLKEKITAITFIAIILIGVGTYLMIQRKYSKNISKIEENINSLENETDKKYNRGMSNGWIIYASLSAIFASLTSILAKVGIQNVESNLGTAIRTIVVLIMAWMVVFINKKQNEVKHIKGVSLVFIILSGIATGASWLCYYKALQSGPASIVVPIDKLSILVTVIFAYLFLKEKLSKKSLLGLVLIVIGTLSLLIKI